jgi:magnesium transporter
LLQIAPPVDDQSAKHPADVADQLERLPIEEASQVLHRLPPEQAAQVLSEVQPDQRKGLVAELTTAQLSEVVKEMPHDQVADLLADMPEVQRTEILAGHPGRSQVVELLRYPEDSAGGIMSDRFITLDADQTVGEALQKLHGIADQETSQSITYLYVTDAARRLVGVVPLRELVFRRPDRRVRDIMTPDVKHVLVDADQETIARMFQHYHYLAVPVLDRDRRLIGIVSANQVIDVLRSEATEDMQLMVGLSGEERARTPWKVSFPKRLQWLTINLITAFLAGGVVGFFESTIAKWTALAIFLPIVAGQGGNAGIQTLTVIIREMALGEMKKGDGWRALGKETLLGLLNGIAIGVLVGVAGYLWKGSVALGIIVAVAMLLNMLAAALAGVMVPFTLRAFRIDPALASGILVTTVTDVAGFLFFLGLAGIAIAMQWV